MTLLGAVALAFVFGVGGGDDLTVNETTVAPGDTITVSGAGCKPDSEVNLFIDGSPFGTTRTDAAGAFLTPVTIADDVGAGSHQVTTIGPLCGTTAVVEVERPESRDESDTSDVLPAIAVLLVAIVVAVTIVIASRRRWPDEPDAGPDSPASSPAAASTMVDSASKT